MSYINQGLVPIEQAMMDLSIADDNSRDNRQRDMGDRDEEISEDPYGNDVPDGANNETAGTRVV